MLEFGNHHMLQKGTYLIFRNLHIRKFTSLLKCEQASMSDQSHIKNIIYMNFLKKSNSDGFGWGDFQMIVLESFGLLAAGQGRVRKLFERRTTDRCHQWICSVV